MILGTSIKECCDIGFAVLEGKHGWMTEALTVLGLVVVFNFFVYFLLKWLHIKFEKEKRLLADCFVRAIYKPLSYYIWFIAITNSIDLISLRVINENVFDDEAMHIIVIFGGIFALSWFLFRWKKNVVKAIGSSGKLGKLKWDQGHVDILSKMLTIGIVFVILILLIEASGRSVQTLLTVGGLGSLAIAFASQEIISNFFSGFIIYMTRPFSVKDWICVPEKDIEGHVEEIGWYTTRIRTFEKRPVYVPNSIFSKQVIVTPSRMSHRQIKEKIGIRYNDMPKLKTILADIKQMLDSHEKIDQKNLVYFASFGECALNVMVEAYTSVIDAEEFTLLKQDILFGIGDIVAKCGAEMASPCTTVDIPKGVTIIKEEE